jgi:two-component system response regulator RegX3
MRILVVEDDAALREGLVDLLTGAGHEVEAASDGPAAVEAGGREPFDLVVLDVMLPGLDGHEACRRMCTSRPGVGILMLTALASREHRVEGLRSGADDYLTKPFAPEELLLRVTALGRRLAAAPAEPERIEADGCLMDLGRFQAIREGRAVPLTPREAGILRWLHRHRRRAVSRGELLERVWGVRSDLETRTVDAAIVKLRQKVERRPGQPRIVVSVQGVGYAWGEEP